MVVTWTSKAPGSLKPWFRGRMLRRDDYSTCHKIWCPTSGTLAAKVSKASRDQDMWEEVAVEEVFA